MNKRITRISPVSSGKIVGVIHGGISFIFAAIGFVAAVVAVLTMPEVKNVAVFFALIGLVVFPLVQGLIGFVVGAIIGLVYNLASGWVGGLQVTFESTHNQQEQPKEADDRSEDI